MIPIVKGHEPAALQKSREISAIPLMRHLITRRCVANPSKGFRRPWLQNKVISCAYCMCRIGVDKHPATIEHLIRSIHPIPLQIASWVLTTITWLPSVMGETGQHATNGVAMLL